MGSKTQRYKGTSSKRSKKKAPKRAKTVKSVEKEVDNHENCIETCKCETKVEISPLVDLANNGKRPHRCKGLPVSQNVHVHSSPRSTNEAFTNQFSLPELDLPIPEEISYESDFELTDEICCEQYKCEINIPEEDVSAFIAAYQRSRKKQKFYDNYVKKPSKTDPGCCYIHGVKKVYPVCLKFYEATLRKQTEHLPAHKIFKMNPGKTRNRNTLKENQAKIKRHIESYPQVMQTGKQFFREIGLTAEKMYKNFLEVYPEDPPGEETYKDQLIKMSIGFLDGKGKAWKKIYENLANLSETQKMYLQKYLDSQTREMIIQHIDSFPIILPGANFYLSLGKMYISYMSKYPNHPVNLETYLAVLESTKIGFPDGRDLSSTVSSEGLVRPHRSENRLEEFQTDVLSVLVTPSNESSTLAIPKTLIFKSTATSFEPQPENQQPIEVQADKFKGFYCCDAWKCEIKIDPDDVFNFIGEYLECPDKCVFYDQYVIKINENTRNYFVQGRTELYQVCREFFEATLGKRPVAEKEEDISSIELDSEPEDLRSDGINEAPSVEPPPKPNPKPPKPKLFIPSNIEIFEAVAVGSEGVEPDYDDDITTSIIKFAS